MQHIQQLPKITPTPTFNQKHFFFGHLEMDKKGSLVPKKPSLLASLYPRKDTTNKSRVLVCASARISNVPLSKEFTHKQSE